MKKGDGWNQRDSESMADLGPKQKDRCGADLSRKSMMSANLSNGRGAVGFGQNEKVKAELGPLDNIGTPSAANEPAFKIIHSRGNVGFGASNFAELGGKPTGPAKP